MKEAWSVIASAWSVAFMLVFVAWAIADIDHAPAMGITLFVAGVTGAGWLGYRASLKERRNKESEHPDGE